jgi:hypothetical protein
MIGVRKMSAVGGVDNGGADSQRLWSRGIDRTLTVSSFFVLTGLLLSKINTPREDAPAARHPLSTRNYGSHTTRSPPTGTVAADATSSCTSVKTLIYKAYAYHIWQARSLHGNKARTNCQIAGCPLEKRLCLRWYFFYNADKSIWG